MHGEYITAYLKMSVLNRLSGFKERPREKLYGRDALFLAERLRRDFWKRHKDREELLIYKDRLVSNQKRAEYTKEVRRLEGFLQHDLVHASRIDYMKGSRDNLKAKLKDLAVTGLPEYSV